MAHLQMIHYDSSIKMDDFHSYVELTRGSQCGVPSPEFPVQNYIWGTGLKRTQHFLDPFSSNCHKIGTQNHISTFISGSESISQFHRVSWEFHGILYQKLSTKTIKKAIVVRFPGSGSCSIGSGWMIAPALEPSGLFYGLWDQMNIEHGWNNKYGIVTNSWDLLGRIGVIHIHYSWNLEESPSWRHDWHIWIHFDWILVEWNFHEHRLWIFVGIRAGRGWGEKVCSDCSRRCRPWFTITTGGEGSSHYWTNGEPPAGNESNTPNFWLEVLYWSYLFGWFMSPFVMLRMWYSPMSSRTEVRLWSSWTRSIQTWIVSCTAGEANRRLPPPRLGLFGAKSLRKGGSGLASRCLWNHIWRLGAHCSLHLLNLLSFPLLSSSFRKYFPYHELWNLINDFLNHFSGPPPGARILFEFPAAGGVLIRQEVAPSAGIFPRQKMSLLGATLADLDFRQKCWTSLLRDASGFLQIYIIIPIFFHNHVKRCSLHLLIWRKNDSGLALLSIGGLRHPIPQTCRQAFPFRAVQLSLHGT